MTGLCLLRMNAISTQIPVFKKALFPATFAEPCERCAKKYAALGDFTAIRVCYLLGNYPSLSPTEVAEALAVSISAASRSLAKLKAAGIVASTKSAQVVSYRLLEDDFTRTLRRQLAPDHCWLQGLAAVPRNKQE